MVMILSDTAAFVLHSQFYMVKQMKSRVRLKPLDDQSCLKNQLNLRISSICRSHLFDPC